jgi:hypothetical protein
VFGFCGVPFIGETEDGFGFAYKDCYLGSGFDGYILAFELEINTP